MYSLVANKNWYQPLSIKKTWICPCSSSIHKTVAFEIQTRDLHTSLPPPPPQKKGLYDISYHPFLKQKKF